MAVPPKSTLEGSSQSPAKPTVAISSHYPAGGAQGAPRPGSVGDDHQPALADLLGDCVHCGFCLPTCPTYVLWGEEMDSPRGRIVLMAESLQEDGDVLLSNELVGHLDNCLGCMACVTSCPSGVKYDQLIARARPQVERHFRRPGYERLFRWAIFATFPARAASGPWRPSPRSPAAWGSTAPPSAFPSPRACGR